MPKDDMLKGGIKQQAKSADRHHATMPDESAARWARELTTKRVFELFKTPEGLPGHWQQIQQKVNAGNNHFFRTARYGEGRNDGGRTTEEGKVLMAWIADAIIAAAGAANFDFPTQQLQFTTDTAWLKISRVRGRVMVHSRP